MRYYCIIDSDPKDLTLFLTALKERGAEIFAVGCIPPDDMNYNLKQVLTEYRFTEDISFEGLLPEFRSLVEKHGAPDVLESHREKFLKTEALLREELSIESGFYPEELEAFLDKRLMKERLFEGGILTGRALFRRQQHGKGNLTKADLQRFSRQTGFPIVGKPCIGNKAEGVFFLHDEADLEEFCFSGVEGDLLLEEYLPGETETYDAITDDEGRPIFESTTHYVTNIFTAVKEGGSLAYYLPPRISEDVKKAGRDVLRLLNLKKRIVHFEFIRLSEDKKGLGKKGDMVALDMNIRPAEPELNSMILLSNGIDVYQRYADMLHKRPPALIPDQGRSYCCYIGRREEERYFFNHRELLRAYRKEILRSYEVPEERRRRMGDQAYIARFPTESEMRAFLREALREKGANDLP